MADLSVKAGLSLDEIDVSRLTELVDGYTLTNRDTVRALLEELESAYFFDAVESGGKLGFIPRGGDVVETIADEEIVPEGKRLLTIR